MVVWLHELDSSMLLAHELFDGGRCLIISDIEGRLESFVGEDIEDSFECGHDVVVRCGGDGDGEDVVRVVSISNKKKLLAVQSSCREISGAVCVEHPFVLVC